MSRNFLDNPRTNYNGGHSYEVNSQHSIPVKVSLFLTRSFVIAIEKQVNRNVQGMSQSQTAANLHTKRKRKRTKTYTRKKKKQQQKTTTNVREAQKLAPSSPSEVIRMLKQTEKRGQRAREDFNGKITQKYKWILSKSIWKTAHFYENCMEIGFLFFKILRFYIFKTAANGGRHFDKYYW